MSDVLVTGFISIDFIGHVEAFPDAAVAQQARELDVACGGRAANQAMALTAVEGDVALIARVGTDEHATLLTEELLDLGVGSEFVQSAPSATGMRMISELPDGTQHVVTYRGANDFLTVDDMNRRAAAFHAASAVGVTTEPAGAVVVRALELAKQGGASSVLTHHASARPVTDRMLAAPDILVVSDATCTGLIDPGIAQTQPEAALRALGQRGAKAVVLLSRTRALLAIGADLREVQSPGRLDSEDAVDAFVAGLLQGLSEGEKLEPAVLRGVRTSCLLVD